MSRFHTARYLNRRQWEAARRATLDRSGWRCEDCGRAGRLEVHHVTPISVDFSRRFDLDNLKVLCKDCHLRAHDKTPEGPQTKAWRVSVDELR